MRFSTVVRRLASFVSSTRSNLAVYSYSRSVPIHWTPIITFHGMVICGWLCTRSCTPLRFVSAATGAFSLPTTDSDNPSLYTLL